MKNVNALETPQIHFRFPFLFGINSIIQPSSNRKLNNKLFKFDENNLHIILILFRNNFMDITSSFPRNSATNRAPGHSG